MRKKVGQNLIFIHLEFIGPWKLAIRYQKEAVGWTEGAEN